MSSPVNGISSPAETVPLDGEIAPELRIFLPAGHTNAQTKLVRDRR
jgi:hypothetical protein